MKKIIGMIAIVMVLCLCACGGSQTADGSADDADAMSDIISVNEETTDSETVKKNLEKATEYLKSAVDTSNMTEDTDDEDPNTIYRYWNMDEIEEITPLSNEIEIDGKKITLGKTTIKDLKDLGFEVETYGDVLEPELETSATLHKGNKELLLSLRANETEQAIPMDDVIVEGFTTGSADVMIPYNYSGLTAEATLKDAIEIFGKPNEQIQITSDVTTDIELAYYSENEEDGQPVAVDFSLQFRYDAEKNDTVLLSTYYSRVTFLTEEE